MINELDKQYAISENYAKGFAEGEARGESRGEARGRMESVLELAKAMKAEGLTLEQIAKITGLQLSEISNL
ncbi:MAG: hypothetical protein NC335_06960 [Bacteroides sp.]|nr:hypothetical protein [Bacteroides sp.]